MTSAHKLTDLARQELPRLADTLIIHTDQGYRAFGHYDIHVHNRRASVSYRGNAQGEFSSPRVALCWCVADKYGQHALAIQIQQLDDRATWTRDNIAQRELVARRNTGDFAEIIWTKIQHRRAQLHAVTQELEKCISQAKYLQQRGFTNDTQRTGPTSPRKTTGKSV